MYVFKIEHDELVDGEWHTGIGCNNVCAPDIETAWAAIRADRIGNHPYEDDENKGVMVDFNVEQLRLTSANKVCEVDYVRAKEGVQCA